MSAAFPPLPPLSLTEWTDDKGQRVLHVAFTHEGKPHDVTLEMTANLDDDAIRNGRAGIIHRALDFLRYPSWTRIPGKREWSAEDRTAFADANAQIAEDIKTLALDYSQPWPEPEAQP